MEENDRQEEQRKADIHKYPLTAAYFFKLGQSRHHFIDRHLHIAIKP